MEDINNRMKKNMMAGVVEKQYFRQSPRSQTARNFSQKVVHNMPHIGDSHGSEIAASGHGSCSTREDGRIPRAQSERQRQTDEN